jgi:hypothetical protein
MTNYRNYSNRFFFDNVVGYILNMQCGEMLSYWLFRIPDIDRGELIVLDGVAFHIDPAYQHEEPDDHYPSPIFLITD